MNFRIVACGAVLLITVFTAVATAQVDVSGSSTSRVTDLTASPNAVNDVHSFDNMTPATALIPTTTTSSAAMANGTSSGSVTASMGSFKGLATSFYSNTGFNEYAETDVRASASDLLTITSLTLALNTPVTLNFGLSVNGTLTSPEVTAGGAYQAFANALFTISNLGSTNTLQLSYNSTQATNTLTGSFAGFVGEQLTLSQSMELTTYVSGSYQFTHPDTSTVDFSHTIQFFGNSATAGASLISASGYDYAAVPEPSTFVLLLVGLLAIGLVRGLAPLKWSAR